MCRHRHVWDYWLWIIDCLIRSFHLHYIYSMTYQKTEGKTSGASFSWKYLLPYDVIYDYDGLSTGNPCYPEKSERLGLPTYIMYVLWTWSEVITPLLKNDISKSNGFSLEFQEQQINAQVISIFWVWPWPGVSAFCWIVLEFVLRQKPCAAI